MIRFLADVSFDHRIIGGLTKRKADLDILVAQEVGLGRTPDPVLLEWAARAGRVVLTHDARTMESFAYDRVRRGEPMPGVVLVGRTAPIGQAIEDILLLVECSLEGDLENQVRHLPL